MKTIRIFISSPGDVAKERERAREVVESLRRRFSHYFMLQPVLWEDLPLQSDTSFQHGIDTVLSENGVDIAIFILWSRLGSPVGHAITKSDGTHYRSGTEREYDLIIQARAAALETEGRARPDILVYTRRDDASFEEALRGTSTEKKEELIQQKKRVESFIAETFCDKETGHNIGAYFPFDRPVTFSQRLRTHLQGLLDQMAGESNEIIWDTDKLGPPFLGLEAFQPQHATVFFGREEEVLEVRHALKEQARNGCAFLLLSGASGSGKSSLACAGVLPAIVELELDEQVAAWRSLVLTPSLLGADPIAALVTCLAADDMLPALGEASLSLPDLVAGLKKDPELTFNLRIKDAFARASAKHGGSVRLLLVLDQLEELFTSSFLAAEDRVGFLAVIETFARSGSVWVLATVRSDFYQQVQSEPTLVRMKSGHGQLDVLPPGPDALQRLIEEPARLSGLTFEKRGDQSLSNRILKDAATHAELLPLVEFVLRELYENRSSHQLTFEAYEALGGVEGALAKRADETYSALPGDAQESLAIVLQALVTLGNDAGTSVAGGEKIVRQRAPLADFDAKPSAKALVDAFIAARLFTTCQVEATGEPAVTVAHESLLRVWPRAKAWANNNRDFLHTRARIAARMQEGSPLLEEDPLLEIAMVSLAANSDGFTEDQRNYLHGSHDRVVEVRKRRTRIRRQVMAGLATLSLVSLMAGIIAAWRYSEESKARQLADRSEAVAQSERLRAESEGQRAEDMLTRMQLQRAEELFTSNDAAGEIAYLASVLRRHPDDTITASRMLSALRDRSYARPLLPPLQHESSVLGLEWSPDERRLVTVTKNHARIWDPATGKLVCDPIPFPTNSNVGNVRFTKDGRYFVVIGTDSQVFESETGKPTSPLLVHKGRVSNPVGDSIGALFSPDGKHIVTATHSKEIKIWDTASGQETASFKIDNFPSAMAYQHDGKRIAVCTDRRVIVLWDTESNRIERILLALHNTPTSLFFSKDGTRLFAYGETVEGYDLTNVEPLAWQIKPKEGITSVDLHPDGRTLMIGTTNHMVRFFSATTGQETLPPWTQTAYVQSSRYSNDGTCVVAVNLQPAVQIWNTVSGRMLCAPYVPASEIKCARLSASKKRLALGTAAGELRILGVEASEAQPMLYGPEFWHPTFVLSPDEKFLVVTDERQQQATVWDFSTGKRVGTVNHDDSFLSLVFHPKSNRFVTGGSQKKLIKTWDCQTGKPARPDINASGWVGMLEFSADGAFLCASSNQVFDFNTGQPVPSKLGKHINASRITPDGKQTPAMEQKNQNVSFFDRATGTLVSAECNHVATVKVITLSSDGQYFATGSDDGKVRVWRVSDASPVTPWLQHNSTIAAIAFSPDSKMLATASFDKTARVWSLPDAKSIGMPIHHAEPVFDVAFSPDGLRLATCSFDQTVRIWDVASGRALSDSLPMRSFFARFVKWTRDGKRLIGGGLNDGLIHSWDVAPVSGNVPPWLPDWAEAIGGWRLDADGQLKRVEDKEWEANATRVNGLSGDDIYTRTAKWFFANRDHRPISPDSSIRLVDYQRLLDDLKGSAAAVAAMHLDPDNARAIVRSLEFIVYEKQCDVAAVLERLDLVEEKNPQEPVLWRVRAALLAKQDGKIDVAISASRQAVKLDPNDWRSQRQLATLLFQKGEYGSVIEPVTQALAHMNDSGYNETLRKELLTLRYESLFKTGRYDEAAKDNLEIHSIEPRDMKAGPKQIDLSAYYNLGLDEDARSGIYYDKPLGEIPHGLQVLGGTTFDIRGMVQLKHKDFPSNLPASVCQIPIAQACGALHFLHTSLRMSGKGKPVANYIVTYEDNTTETVTAISGPDIGSIYRSDMNGPPPPAIAWRGETSFTRKWSTKDGKTFTVCLYKMTWKNPHPEKVVKSLDFVSVNPNEKAPVLFAVTAD